MEGLSERAPAGRQASRRMAGMNVLPIPLDLHRPATTRPGQQPPNGTIINELMVEAEEEKEEGRDERDRRNTWPENVPIKFSARSEDIYFSNG